MHGIEPVADWQGACALPPSIAAAAVLPLERGFVSTGLAVIAEQDILGARSSRQERRRRKPAEEFLVDVAALADGDLVVHVDHGIGRYDGLVTLEVDHAPPRLPAHPLRGRRPALPAGGEHRPALALRLGRPSGCAGPTGRRRLAGAQGEAQATHPRHGEPAHRARRRARDQARRAARGAWRPLRRLLRGLPLRRDRGPGARHR